MLHRHAALLRSFAPCQLAVGVIWIILLTT
jgi:hypothetical protein